MELNEDSSTEISLIGNDIDGDNLTFSIVSAPSSGSAVVSDGVITYIPNLNYSGEDVIGYISDDGELQSEIAFINIISVVNKLYVNSFENENSPKAIPVFQTKYKFKNNQTRWIFKLTICTCFRFF